MKAIITRNMNVMNANGENEFFAKSGGAIEIDAETFGRLRRAGAATPYVAPDIESALDQVLAKAGFPEFDTTTTGTDVVQTPDLDAMTKDQLVDFAVSKVITINPAGKKADIIAAIKADINKAANPGE
jgi:hypothetical protein